MYTPRKVKALNAIKLLHEHANISKRIVTSTPTAKVQL